MVEQASLVISETEGICLSRSLVEMIESLPVGKYKVIIESQGEICSIPQRRLMWMWFTLLASYSGESKVKWYKYYCHKFLEEGVDSAKNLTSLQLTYFMQEVQADVATEFGIRLPIPEDGDIYNSFVREYKNR